MNTPTSGMGVPPISPTTQAPTPDPYEITLQGVKLDPYKIVELYGITSMPIAQALKKLLRCGRKHKSLAQDVRDAITSLQRWEELQKESLQPPHSSNSPTPSLSSSP